MTSTGCRTVQEVSVPIDSSNRQFQQTVPPDSSNRQFHQTVPIDSSNRQFQKAFPIDSSNTFPTDISTRQFQQTVPIDSSIRQFQQTVPLDSSNRQSQCNSHLTYMSCRYTRHRSVATITHKHFQSHADLSIVTSDVVTTIYIFQACGPDNSVSTATGYGAEQSGDQIPARKRFFASVATTSGAHPASYTMDTASFPGVKRPGRGVDHPSHLAPRLKKEQSYIYSPSGPSCQVKG